MNFNGVAEPSFEIPLLSLLFRNVVRQSPLLSTFEIPAVILKEAPMIKMKASDPRQYDRTADRRAYPAALKG